MSEGQNEGTGRLTAANLLAAAVIGVLTLLIAPLPAFLLDALLALNLAASAILVFVALRVREPMELSVFPSLLLLLTLFRLGLNVASTRLILLNGADGEGAAGRVVDAFGQFAVGGNAVIGAVIFLILLAVNFMVITKGSGRISEVSARFTLDALPGKQMSIDADLAAGMINDVQARERRKRLEQETEFFGAMDGASKFVRGDAVAGLAITAINILGGLIAGILAGLDVAKAAETYTILTIGDGLVSQIPALLISTAAGILVTRGGTTGDLAKALQGQIFGRPAVLTGAAVVLLGIGVLPKMPLVPFGFFAVVLLYLASRARRQNDPAKLAAEKVREQRKKEEEEPDRIEDSLVLDTVELELGLGLVNLIDLDRGGELPARVTSLRKQLAVELGIVLPAVHLKDSLTIEAGEYRVLFRGQEVAKGTAFADRLMALEPMGGEPDIEGVPAEEPAFGLPARWIPKTARTSAEARGLTVVDPSSVITTHLGEVLRRFAYELVGRQEAQDLIAVCGKDAPKLVEEVVPATVSLGELVQVVRGLLRERISVRDMRSILEAIADASIKSKEIPFLVEQVRRRLARQITGGIQAEDGVVRVVTLDPQCEQQLRSSLAASDGEPALAPDLDTARNLIDRLNDEVTNMAGQGWAQVVLVSPDLRRPLFEFASRFVPDLLVVTARELAPGVPVESVATIGLNQLPCAA